MGESIGWGVFVVLLIVIIGLFVVSKISKTNKRKSQLMAKYQDEDLVERLMNNYFWQGQSASELIDSLGKPEDVDRKVLKTKTKEVWKYNHQGGKRYGLRITLDNDVVVGWDKKT
ncbi:MAG: DUF2845 domain-containing protein [gamma proteobacterium symbiont of Clathrolucina costata]